MDADFDDLLKSEVADVKQCSAETQGDHILAARFLSRFVPTDVPWIHVDLSAGQHKDGLAHVPTLITGFGVRLTVELLGRTAAGPDELAKRLCA
jgi:leucyl aminopeptidase